jgi:hypothetical protein
MNKVHRKFVSWFLSILAIALSIPAWAGTIINNFTTTADYVANGIIGETNWDGVYLRIGDFQGQTPTVGSGGNTVIANTTTFPGYLGVRSQNNGWSGVNDDGFFIYKVVQGDFDVFVETYPANLNGGTTFDNGADNFVGLMVRAYNTNNSGSPFSTTSTNASENFVLNWRFDEFNLDGEVRISTNGANIERTFPEGTNTTDALSTPRYFRIVRTGNVFTFFSRTNSTDSWIQITNGLAGGNLTRNDWTGVALQVGIAQADFVGATHDSVFTDFELAATNVAFPAFPAAPSALVATATNTGGSITFSWTLGNPGDSSLVVMRQGGNIQQNPINGVVYSADAAFGDPATRVDGNEFVVYNGTGTNVTVTNLGGLNLTYNLAVYEYSNPAAPIYNTAAPVTNSTAGPGIVAGVATSISPTNIPIGGAALGKLFATFSSGPGTVDESANASWISSDPTIANFTGSVLTGITNGSVSVTGAFAGFFATTNITVHSPVFTDAFTNNQDYIANGLEGSEWDGLVLNFGDIPGANAGPEAAKGATTIFNANVSSNGVLSIQAAGSSWNNAGNDGPYLFKFVTGDFQASVHVHAMDAINANDVGLMARLYNGGQSATTQNAPGGANGTETHINWVKVQNGAPALRRTIDGGGTTIINGISGSDGWLLMQRVNSTNFFVYESTTNIAWTFVTNLTMLEASNNAPMEIGIEQEMRTASVGNDQLDSMMIDGPGIVSATGVQPPPPASNITTVINSDLTMTISWSVPLVNSSPAETILIMRDGGPVTAQPYYGFVSNFGAGTYNYGQGADLGNGNFMIYRSANPGTNVNITVTIGGLTPGDIYDVAAYTFVGSSTTKVFNDVLPTNAIAVGVQDGALLGVTVRPTPTIPLGGIAIPQVIGTFTGGGKKNVSAFSSFFPASTNIVLTTNGILSGMSLGSTTVTNIYKGFTNLIGAVVRSPVFTDAFTNAHDYLNNGVAGTPYDGMYNPNAVTGVEIPESLYVPLAGSGATVADADISTNGMMTITGAGDGWENTASGGFFLFKYVPGDFQVATHVNPPYDNGGYNQSGVLARAYSTGTNGTDLGAPFVLGPSIDAAGNPETNAESWIDLTRFDENFGGPGIGTYARENLDGNVLESTQPASGDGELWLLITRTGWTNFAFYMRQTNTAPWQPVPLGTTYQVPEFLGVPMQVGLMDGPWNGTSGPGGTHTVRFDSYMLDYTTAPSPSVAVVGGNVIVTWAADPNLVLQSTVNINPSNWQNVPGTPTLGVNGYSLTLPITAVHQFFRLKQ